MAELIEIKEKEELLVLVGVATDESEDIEASLDELAELVDTAGGSVVGRIIQNREKQHPGTYIGKGKIEEVRELAESLSATGIVCDDELSPAQMKNLEDAIGLKVMDRTMVILDIFAQRASTREGKIQVELAQLKYRSTRLIGMGNVLSRLGGGIGTRGPGEKKLEVDRRLIKDRIARLNRELETVKQDREVMRSRRMDSHIPVAAIVGYTNAGKSTLLNKLTNAGVLEEDKLFATLDPTTRNYTLENGQEVLFTDTVGFIKKLPHHLVNAFRSTLEEAKYADIIIHVADASNPQVYTHMYVVYDTLRQLGIKDKPVITLLNKQDLVEDDEPVKDLKADKVIKISAKHGTGFDEFLGAVDEILKNGKVYLEKIFSYNEAGKIQRIRKYGQLLSEEYVGEGISVKAYVPKEIYDEIAF